MFAVACFAGKKGFERKKGVAANLLLLQQCLFYYHFFESSSGNFMMYHFLALDDETEIAHSGMETDGSVMDRYLRLFRR